MQYYAHNVWLPIHWRAATVLELQEIGLRREHNCACHVWNLHGPRWAKLILSNMLAPRFMRWSAVLAYCDFYLLLLIATTRFWASARNMARHMLCEHVSEWWIKSDALLGSILRRRLGRLPVQVSDSSKFSQASDPWDNPRVPDSPMGDMVHLGGRTHAKDMKLDPSTKTVSTQCARLTFKDAL